MNVIIATYYLYTLGWTEGVQYSVTQDLSTNTHIEKYILHYCVRSSVLIAMTCPHSLWCSAGHFTSFSSGLCHTEEQSVQMFVLIKPPLCPPLLCSGWHVQLRLIQFNAATKHLWRVDKKIGNLCQHCVESCLSFRCRRRTDCIITLEIPGKVTNSVSEEKGHLSFSYSNILNI